MAERPILFSGPMIRALLAGTKVQTRRAVKPQPTPNDRGGFHWPSNLCRSMVDIPDMGSLGPYGSKGDRLWVRETFDAPPGSERRSECAYRADYERDPDGARWRPSIYMPRWASRITLEVVSVRVERMQDITEEDAKREGIQQSQARGGRDGFYWCGAPHKAHGAPTQHNTPVEAFASLWDSINGKRPGCSWFDNPWVWAISFKRVEAAT